MAFIKKIWTYLVIVAVAVGGALIYEFFVFPNSFAPSGVNGICTIIQYLFGINLGYPSLLLNIPLALLVFFKVSRPIAVRSMVYVVVFSVSLVILGRLDLSALVYYTENGTSRILGPLTAGIMMGCSYSILIKASAYTGGTDFIAALIHSKHPEKSVFALSFVLNGAVAVLSFFVYDYKIEPVLLSVLYSFASTVMADRAMRAGRGAVRFEIITKDSKEIAAEIIALMHHSATVVPAHGAYSGNETEVLICIVNKGQSAILYDILRRHPGSFAVMDPVSEVVGNFKHITKQGKDEVEILDKGDGKTV